MFGIRALVLSLLTALALLQPVASLSAGNPPISSAASRAKQKIYWVYYRCDSHHAWTCYGGYYHLNQAVQAVTWFRYYGYEAFYR
ncbi:MAG TPA: hypothetical protein PLN21_06080 [Gemmatales bacterium]|nr:hypothetical protein [Gemmatales bacterium]